MSITFPTDLTVDITELHKPKDLAQEKARLIDFKQHIAALPFALAEPKSITAPDLEKKPLDRATAREYLKQIVETQLKQINEKILQLQSTIKKTQADHSFKIKTKTRLAQSKGSSYTTQKIDKLKKEISIVATQTYQAQKELRQAEQDQKAYENLQQSLKILTDYYQKKGNLSSRTACLAVLFFSILATSS
jgi:hypothetical protein